MQEILYKVLEDGKSVHGGNLTWSLPTPDGDNGFLPGDWHEVWGQVVICRNGLHLTTNPYGRWMTFNASVYEAEGAGDVVRDGDTLSGIARVVVVLGLSGLIYGFLDPNFGLNEASVILFIALIVLVVSWRVRAQQN